MDYAVHADCAVDYAVGLFIRGLRRLRRQRRLRRLRLAVLLQHSVYALDMRCLVAWVDWQTQRGQGPISVSMGIVIRHA